MKYNVHKLASMLNQFILDYAQRFSIPELAKLDHTNIDATKEDSGFIVVRVKDPIPFCPSGQFASLVSDAQIGITATEDRFGRFSVEMRTSYEHHNSGSNGVRQSFMLITKRDGLGDDIVYKGFMFYEHYIDIISKHNEAVEIVQKEKEATKA